jgi:hypothetical protein
MLHDQARFSLHDTERSAKKSRTSSPFKHLIHKYSKPILDYAAAVSTQAELRLQLALFKEAKVLEKENVDLMAQVKTLDDQYPDAIDFEETLRLLEETQLYIGDLHAMSNQDLSNSTTRASVRFKMLRKKLRFGLLKLKVGMVHLPFEIRLAIDTIANEVHEFTRERLEEISIAIQTIKTSILNFSNEVGVAVAVAAETVNDFFVNREDVPLVMELDERRNQAAGFVSGVSDALENVIDTFYKKDLDFDNPEFYPLLEFMMHDRNIEISSEEEEYVAPKNLSVDCLGRPLHPDGEADTSSESSESEEHLFDPDDGVIAVYVEPRVLPPVQRPQPQEPEEWDYDLFNEELAPMQTSIVTGCFTYVHPEFQGSVFDLKYCKELTDALPVYHLLTYSYQRVVTTVRNMGTDEVDCPLVDLRGDSNSAGRVTRLIKRITRHKSKTIEIKKRHPFLLYPAMAIEAARYVAGLPIRVWKLVDIRITDGRHASTDVLGGQIQAPKQMNLQSSHHISRVNMDLAIRTINSVNLPWSMAYERTYGPLAEGTAWQAAAWREYLMWSNIGNGTHFRL